MKCISGKDHHDVNQTKPKFANLMADIHSEPIQRTLRAGLLKMQTKNCCWGNLESPLACRTVRIVQYSTVPYVHVLYSTVRKAMSKEQKAERFLCATILGESSNLQLRLENTLASRLAAWVQFSSVQTVVSPPCYIETCMIHGSLCTWSTKDWPL